MNSKTLIGAAVLAAILALIGLLAYHSGAPPAEASEGGGLVFPELLEKVNDSASLTLVTDEGEFHVERSETGWALAERGGYPVQMDKVRKTLIGLAELETIEQKTSNPVSYGQLGVQAVGADPTAETQSKQVVVKDAAGAELASLIVGKSRPGGGTFYARRSGDTVSWLVRGELPPLPAKGDEWLDKKILEVQRADVRAARIRHAEGEDLTISKKDSDTDYTLHELPADRELKYASVANSVAGALQYLNFEDVMPAAEFEKPEAHVSVTNLWTKDGMRVTVELWEKDEKYYAAFSASYDPDSSPALDLGPPPPPEEGEGVAIAEATPRPAEEVRPEVEALNARLSPWIYQIPEYSKNNFTKQIEDLLKPLPEPTVEPPAEGTEPGTPTDGLGGPPLDPPPPGEAGSTGEEQVEGDGSSGDGASGDEANKEGDGTSGDAQKKTDDPGEGGE